MFKLLQHILTAASKKPCFRKVLSLLYEFSCLDYLKAKRESNYTTLTIIINLNRMTDILSLVRQTLIKWTTKTNTNEMSHSIHLVGQCWTKRKKRTTLLYPAPNLTHYTHLQLARRRETDRLDMQKLTLLEVHVRVTFRRHHELSFFFLWFVLKHSSRLTGYMWSQGLWGWADVEGLNEPLATSSQ